MKDHVCYLIESSARARGSPNIVMVDPSAASAMASGAEGAVSASREAMASAYLLVSLSL